MNVMNVDALFTSEFLNDSIDYERINFIYNHYPNDSFGAINVLFHLYTHEVPFGNHNPTNCYEINEVLSNGEGFVEPFANKLKLLKNRSNQYSSEDFQVYILLRQFKSILLSGLTNFIADYIHFPLLGDLMYLFATISMQNTIKWTNFLKDIEILTTQTTYFNHNIFELCNKMSFLNRIKYYTNIVTTQTIPPLTLLQSISFDSDCVNGLVLLTANKPLKGKEMMEFFETQFGLPFKALLTKKRK